MKTVNIIHECQQLELVGCFRYSIVWKHGKCTSMHLDPKGIGMLCTSSLVPNLARQIFFSPSYSSSYGAWVTGSRVI